MSRQVAKHKHTASEIVETTDDYLLAALRSARDPSKIERTIIEDADIPAHGSTFPPNPVHGQIFHHTGWNMTFRYDASASCWVSLDYGLDKAVTVTVNASGTSITIQNHTTGETVTYNTTGLSIVINSTGITINVNGTSITIQLNTTGMTNNGNSTGVTNNSGSTSITNQSTMPPYVYYDVYTGTLTVAAGGTNGGLICNLEANGDYTIECALGLYSGDTIAYCRFYFYFYREESCVSQIGAPIGDWIEVGSGVYPWMSNLVQTTGSSGNHVNIWIKNTSADQRTWQYQLRVYKRSAHTHTVSDPTHGHTHNESSHGHTHSEGTGHNHTPNDPQHSHSDTDPNHAHSTSEGSGHPHGTSDPGHIHTPNDPTHGHGGSSPAHDHDVLKTGDPP